MNLEFGKMAEFISFTKVGSFQEDIAIFVCVVKAKGTVIAQTRYLAVQWIAEKFY